MGRESRHAAYIVLAAWALLVGVGLLARGCRDEPVPSRAPVALQREILAERVTETEREESQLVAQLVAAAPQFRPIPGRLLAVPNLAPQRRRALINRGRAHGVREGQGVVCRLGLVGRVSRVHEHSAWVILADDPEFRVVMISRRHSTRIIARGGPDRGRLESLFHEHPPDYEPGDVAITAGDAIYPRGILLGEVTAATAAPPRVSVRLPLDPADAGVIAVLAPPTEAEELEEERP